MVLTLEDLEKTFELLRKPGPIRPPQVVMSKKQYDAILHTDVGLAIMYGFNVRDGLLVSGWAY